MKTMFIVGNGMLKKDLSSLINNGDMVIRFNNLNNYDIGTGSKIDVWVLSSNKFLMNEFIEDPKCIKGNTNKGVKEITELIKSIFFSIPIENPLKHNAYRKKFQQILMENRRERIKSVDRFLKHFTVDRSISRTIEFPNKYLYDLSPEIWSSEWIYPSNGYLITRMFIDDPAFWQYKIYLLGFTWEGWQGHPWVLERLYLEKLERDGLITIFR